MAFSVQGCYLVVQTDQRRFGLHCDGRCMLTQRGRLLPYGLPFPQPPTLLTEHLLTTCQPLC